MPGPTQVVILGGGLAGLSCAYHLKRPSVVIEKSDAVGGTARSFLVNGFTFDHTGHLLHLHHPDTKKLILGLLKGNLTLRRRDARIHSHGVETPYPFQANTYGLPPDVIKECVLGFLNRPNSLPKKIDYSKVPFDEWCLSTFGEGITKHFMGPYNHKLWGTPGNRMTADWCGQFVPTPSLDDIVRGAISNKNAAFGYNVSFYYPKQGGIQTLPEAMAKGLDVRLSTGAELVDWKNRRVKTSDGNWFPYSHLVNTMPLVELLNRMPGLPAPVRRDAAKLRWTSVMCLNIGVDRPKISTASWLYFPEPDFVFYRVGFPMNFTPHAVPKGCSSMYVEVSFRPGHPPEPKFLLRKVRSGLIRAGILKPRDRFPVVQFLPIKYAYVIYDQARAEALPQIFKFLAQNRIQSIGRYGAWKYSFMEEAIRDGRSAAEKIAPQS